MSERESEVVEYRDHVITEYYSFQQISPMRPTTHKRFSCLIDGQNEKGTLDELKAKIDHHLGPVNPTK